MNMKDRLHSGELYLPDDPEIVRLQQECLEKLYAYNATRPGDSQKRAALLQEMFAEIGKGCHIEPPLHSNWGGHHVHLGAHVYANFNLPLVDDTHIYIEDHTMFGPCLLYTSFRPDTARGQWPTSEPPLPTPRHRPRHTVYIKR